MKIDWIEFKTQVDNRKLNIQYIELSTYYMLKAFDGPFELQCTVIKKDPIIDPSDQKDFEDNYKAISNSSFTDDDGRTVTRHATAKKGWNFFEHVVELKTNTLNGCLSLNWDNTDRGMFDFRMYELISGVETLMVQGADDDTTYQTKLTNNCIRTDMILRPDYDYELIGGVVSQISAPASDARLWVIAGATDLGAAGVKEFIGGKNLAFMGDQDHKSDGRTAKFMCKDKTGVPVPANKIQFIIRHAKGAAHRLEISLDYFKA